jgi:hypothetical protein
MKIIVALLIMVCLSGTVFSQTYNPPKIISIPSIKYNSDTLFPKKEGDQRNRIPNYGMPNVITNAMPPIYKGNNNKGFDIYESPLDQMPILMPDSTNYQNMLTLKMQKKTGPPEQANNIPKFIIKELEERQKARDSLYMKKSKPGIFTYPKD